VRRSVWRVGILLLLGAIFLARPGTAHASPGCHPDLTGDGIIDIFDLVRVTAQYQSEWPGALLPAGADDTNGDRRVDLLDLICVAIHYGASSPLNPSTPLPTATALPTPAPTPTPALPPMPERGNCEPASVVRVEDGDTVLVSLRACLEQVRYVNVDAPESYDPFGDEAAAYNRSLAGSRILCLERDPNEPRDRDRYGRLLRYVWVGDMLVEAAMVEAGYAEVVAYRPGYRYQPWLLELQAAAMRDGCGMWR